MGSFSVDFRHSFLIDAYFSSMCIIRLSAKGTNGVMKPVGFRTFLEFVILSTERSVYYRTRGGEWRGCIAATPHVYMVRSSVKASTIGANK